MSIISISKRVDQVERRLSPVPPTRVVVAFPGQTDQDALIAAGLCPSDPAHLIHVAFVAAAGKSRSDQHVDA